MDELDLLKKDWNERADLNEKVSEKEIYKMMRRSSSSIVKWLLIISAAEFSFWTILTILINDSSFQNKVEFYGISEYLMFLNVANYIILIVFIIIFHRNYRKISVGESTQKLMQRILETRKIVKYYIIYNISFLLINILISLLLLFYHNQEMSDLLQNALENGSRSLFLILCIFVTTLFVGLVVVAFWIFYKLLYGILLKKLLENYAELNKS